MDFHPYFASRRWRWSIGFYSRCCGRPERKPLAAEHRRQRQNRDDRMNSPSRDNADGLQGASNWEWVASSHVPPQQKGLGDGKRGHDTAAGQAEWAWGGMAPRGSVSKYIFLVSNRYCYVNYCYSLWYRVNGIRMPRVVLEPSRAVLKIGPWHITIAGGKPFAPRLLCVVF